MVSSAVGRFTFFSGEPPGGPVEVPIVLRLLDPLDPDARGNDPEDNDPEDMAGLEKATTWLLGGYGIRQAPRRLQKAWDEGVKEIKPWRGSNVGLK